MNPHSASTFITPSETGNQSLDSVHDRVSQNVGSIREFYAREALKTGRSQRVLEGISDFVGRPLYLTCTLLFVGLWIAGNSLALRFGRVAFDPPPFLWLQGLIGLGALLMTTVILIKQNRLARLEEQRAHLDLQVNLLAEQKTSKLIHLIEELRRDLPIVHDRHDPEAEALKQHADPHLVLSALEDIALTEARLRQASRA